MPSIRFRLDRPTLSGLAARVAEQYGPEARIVDTEESVVGGIGGLFGKRVIDVVVQVPDHAAPDGAHEFSMRSRVGLAALLDDADAMDLGPASAFGPESVPPPAPGPANVSTQGGDFASVLDALRIDVEPSDGAGGTPARPLRRRRPEPPPVPTTFTAIPATPRSGPRPGGAAAVAPVRRPEPRALRAIGPAAPPAPPPALSPELAEAAAREYQWATPTPRSRMGMTAPGAPPPPRTRSGDLLLLVGVGDDAVRVAKAVRDRLQKGYVCDGGSVEGNTRRRVDDRRGAIAARAYAVRSEQPVIVAYGIGDGDVDDPRYGGLLSIDSDQAWLVVDAGRRPEQTLAWTDRLRGRLQVDAVASIGAVRGERQEAVTAIGLPEAWRELAG